ncbi:MAG TPA: hypothetical protein V6D50_03605 [Chroococcales cyanobacterium]
MNNLIFTGYHYSVLRLGGARFRLGLYGELADYWGLTFERTITQSKIGLRAWAKRCDRISSEAIASIAYRLLALLESAALNLLPQITCVELPQSRLDLNPIVPP